MGNQPTKREKSKVPSGFNRPKQSRLHMESPNIEKRKLDALSFDSFDVMRTKNMSFKD